jgi:hypothetical protein
MPDDLDDLDDMMDGMGLAEKKDDGMGDFFGGPKKKKKTAEVGQERDTLGFLKRADDEKRQKAEDKLKKE